MKSICNIAIIENFALFSSGIKSLLYASEEIKVVAEGTSPESLSLNAKIPPDIILFDMVHFHDAGIAIVKEIGMYFPNVPILMVTSQNYSDCFKEYLKFGTKGFIFTDDNPEELIFAIKTICLGNEYFKKHLAQRALSALPSPVKTKGRPPKDNPLTKREIEVLKLFCDGLTYKEIGSKLQISARTVETHKKNIMRKLRITKRAEMIKYATRKHFTTN